MAASPSAGVVAMFFFFFFALKLLGSFFTTTSTEQPDELWTTEPVKWRVGRKSNCLKDFVVHLPIVEPCSGAGTISICYRAHLAPSGYTRLARFAVKPIPGDCANIDGIHFPGEWHRLDLFLDDDGEHVLLRMPRGDTEQIFTRKLIFEKGYYQANTQFNTITDPFAEECIQHQRNHHPKPLLDDYALLWVLALDMAPLEQNYFKALRICEAVPNAIDFAAQFKQPPLRRMTAEDKRQLDNAIELGRAYPVVQTWPRGKALIICNENFKDPGARLPGAAADGRRMSTLMAQLGYHVTTVVDGTASQIERYLSDFKRRGEIGDSSIIYIASHGVISGIWSSDEKFVKVHSIIDAFDLLTKKPKLLLIDACRDYLHARPPKFNVHTHLYIAFATGRNNSAREYLGGSGGHFTTEVVKRSPETPTTTT